MCCVELLAGRNYLFRVRPCVGGKWIDWSQAVQSDVVSIPACRPNPPYEVRIASVPEDEDGITIRAPVSNLRPVASSKGIAAQSTTVNDYDSDQDNAGIPKPVREQKQKHEQEQELQSEQRKEILDIGHDFLVICWMNGRANGSPVLEYQIDVAQIREYRESDIVDKPYIPKKKTKGNKLSPSKEESEMVSIPNVELSKLEWVDVSKQGDFLGPNAFRVTDLQSGTSYCFRVR